MRWTKVLLVGAGTLACSSMDSHSAPAAGPGQAADNGQTGSPGDGCDADECQADAQRWLNRVADTSVLTFVDSLCQAGSNVGSSETLTVRSCKCILGDGRAALIPATGM